MVQKPSSQQQQTDDVVRVKTELVQTDVTVLDRRGRVVAGLKPEQFELRVDAKPQSLAFFEQVSTGSAEEEKQLTAVGRTPLLRQSRREAPARNRIGDG